MFELYNIAFILALRMWIMHEDQILSAGRSNLVDIALGDTRMARAFDALAAAHYEHAMVLGTPPNPDLLLRLGPVGRFTHAVVCQTKDAWAAFNKGVNRRHPDIPSLFPMTEAERQLESYKELFVSRNLEKLSGVTVAEIHPVLGTTKYRADFRVKAANGQSLYIEVVMISDDPANDNWLCGIYRCRLATKLIVYAQLGLEVPVIIGADDLEPRRLEAKMAEILGRLALPVPPPRPVSWFECRGEFE